MLRYTTTNNIKTKQIYQKVNLYWGQEWKREKIKPNKSALSDWFTQSWCDPLGRFCWQESSQAQSAGGLQHHQLQILLRNMKQQNYLPKTCQPGTDVLLTSTKLTYLQQRGDLSGETLVGDVDRKKMNFRKSCWLSYPLLPSPMPYLCHHLPVASLWPFPSPEGSFPHLNSLFCISSFLH